ncbi:MAG: imidazole glycerol phosphate synthase subunit HisH [Anaerolineales bacterium]|nr:imidazole glycerol phosphate synthase subunit HisH [Anaerolineales bacterium]
MKIVLIDHGVGNLRSVEKALAAVGGEIQITADPRGVAKAEKIVLPGVGAFADAMMGMKDRGLIEPVLNAVREGTPLLGICVGMQMLFDSSEEHGHHPGLGLLPGSAVRFRDPDLTIPQTGWNQIHPTRPDPLLENLDQNSYAYFNHTYYCAPDRSEDILASTQYGVSYASVVQRDNLYGVQFHPEKSQGVGLAVLKNFVHLVKDKKGVSDE